MKVVIVGGCLPYPANSGNRIRTLNLIVRLAKRHRLTYIATRNPDRDEARAAVDHLSACGIEPVEVTHTVPPKSGVGFYARLAANMVSPRPYSVASHHAPALTAEVGRRLARGGVDLWQAEWAAGMEALAGAGVPAGRTVVVAHNVETLIWERYAANESRPPHRLYIKMQARKYAAYERRVLRAAGRVVAVSPDDAALMSRRFGVPAGRIDVVDNGLDRAAYEGLQPSVDHDPRRILFLGSLEWRPNLDAVDLLLDRILPAVRAAEPGAMLEIVGRNPPAALARRVAATPGATLHANVTDVRPHLARAGVMAVPLRIGGGSRLKILEALGAGVPVVSTRVGAEGLELGDGRDLSIVDDERGMADGLIAALRDPGAARAQAERGRAHVLQRYDWDALADALERAWERCLHGESEPRGTVLAAAGAGGER